jgi:hypothetical protein
MASQAFCWFWDKKLKAKKGWGGGLPVDKFRLGFFLSPQNFLRPYACAFFSPPIFLL